MPHKNRYTEAMYSRMLKTADKARKTPFIQGVAFYQMGGIVMQATGFVSSVLFARILGLREFGVYALISAFVGFISIITAYGQDISLPTYLAEAVGKKDRNAISAVLRYYAQATLLSWIVFVCLFVFAPTLAVVLHGDPLIGTYGRIAILNSMLQPPIVLLFTALQIERRNGTVVLLESGSDIIQLLISAGLLMLGLGVRGILVGTLSVSLLSLIPFLWLYNRSALRQGLPGIGTIIGGMFRGGTRGVAKQGLWMAIDANISKNLYPNLFYLALNAIGSLEAVGIFRIAMRLSAVPSSVIMPSITRMTNIAIPRMAGENPGALYASCKKVLVGTLGLSLLASLGAAIVAPPLIPIVYGREYAAVIPIFLLLLIPNILASTHVLTIPLLRIFRRIWMISITNILGIVLGLGAFFVLLSVHMNAIWSVSIGITVFHANMLLLFPILLILVRERRRRRIAGNV